MPIAQRVFQAPGACNCGLKESRPGRIREMGAEALLPTHQGGGEEVEEGEQVIACFR